MCTELNVTESKQVLVRSRTGQPIIHPFESAGLGKAPFRFIGVTENRFIIPGAGYKPGGCCSYCGTGILFEYRVKSADGKVSTIGSECIRKINKMVYAPTDMMQAIREHERQLRHAREKKQLEELSAVFFSPEHQALFERKPHPHPYYEAQGKSYWDFMTFCWNASGTAGKISLGRGAKKRLEEKKIT